MTRNGQPVTRTLYAVALQPGREGRLAIPALRVGSERTAPLTLILSAVPYRTAWRYGQRGYRYLYLDAGHAGQNIHLAAEALGGGACMIGAYQDEAMDACLGLDGREEFVIYVAAVGKK